MMLYDDPNSRIDADDILCPEWAQPEIPLADLPRMRIDRQGLRAAAETIVRFETATIARDALAHGDPRLAPYLREAMLHHRETA